MIPPERLGYGISIARTRRATSLWWTARPRKPSAWRSCRRSGLSRGEEQRKVRQPDPESVPSPRAARS